MWLVFTVTWSLGVLFHVAGNTRIGPDWGRAAVGMAALLLLARPRSRRLAGVLSVAVIASVWLEAPLLGNHWLLHGLVAVTVLAGLGLSVGRGSEVMSLIAGPLRLLLLAFYSFAAFAKLNGDFFDPTVSCGVFYFEESARSWGLGALAEGLSGAAKRGVAVVVAAVELTIPLLLVVRRTRSLGVVLALSFHFVLALDRSRHFFDFSAALVPLFLLFLPPAGLVRASQRLADAVRRATQWWPSGLELLRLLALACAVLVVVIASGPEEWPAPPVLRAVGLTVWVLYGLGALLLAVTAIRRVAPLGRLVPTRPPLVLLAVPVFAVVNGLTPYLEVKTGASWNMYSNLAVVDGDSNHLLVRSGLPLTDAHDRLVEIVTADGVDMGFYIGTDWRLPERMLEDHLAATPGAVVHGRLDGRVQRFTSEGSEARPAWQRKLQVFRAVDGVGPVSCQAFFGLAR